MSHKQNDAYNEHIREGIEELRCLKTDESILFLVKCCDLLYQARKNKNKWADRWSEFVFALNQAKETIEEKMEDCLCGNIQSKEKACTCKVADILKFNKGDEMNTQKKHTAEYEAVNDMGSEWLLVREDLTLAMSNTEETFDKEKCFKFLAKACNNHERLLEACIEARDWMQEYYRASGDTEQKETYFKLVKVITEAEK